MAAYALRPHVADVILEAWAPDRLGCMAAAVEGLVASFADPQDAVPDRSVPFALAPAPDADLLVRLLEEVVFVVDALGRVPVETRIAEADGGLRGTFATVAVDRVEEVGAFPKGVSRSGAELAPDEGPEPSSWHCRVLVDV